MKESTDSEKAKAACSTIAELAAQADTSDPGYLNSLVQIEENLNLIESYFSQPENFEKVKFAKLTKKQKQDFMKESNLDAELIKMYAKRKKKKTKAETRVAYTLYESSSYGKLSNRFFERIADRLVKSYPEILAYLYKTLRASGVKVLSQTYISMLMFSSVLAFIAVTPLAIILLKHALLPIQIIRGFLLGIMAAAITGVIFYFYPASVAKTRESAIKQDLPFVITHMAAVAGSGGKPISIFTTVLSSDEYPGVRDEIKKIVNYVNLFGYDLSTALSAVARRTPSLKFKDLLDGIVNTVESGGDMKDYLEAMADEALTTYRLERKKSVESISTYSDIYTTVLIAAPLLFFVTLAIIQTMGGEFGGVRVSTLAVIGTYFVIPVLNIGYMIFLSVVQPK